MHRRADGHSVDLATIIPPNVTEICLPDGSCWNVDAVQHCPDDDRLRLSSVWRKAGAACRGCGDELTHDPARA